MSRIDRRRLDVPAAPVSVVLTQAPFATTTNRDLSPNTFLLPMNCPALNPTPRVVVAACFPSTTDRPVARRSSDGTALRNDDVATTGGRDPSEKIERGPK